MSEVNVLWSSAWAKLQKNLASSLAAGDPVVRVFAVRHAATGRRTGTVPGIAHQLLAGACAQPQNAGVPAHPIKSIRSIPQR